jgi:hypothetical protein
MSDLPPPPPGNLTPPPGYVAYGMPGTAGGNIQRINGLTTALTVLVGIVVPLQFIGIFTTLELGRKVHRLATGAIKVEEFKSSNVGGLASIGGLLIIPIAVLTMIWMFRMAANVEVLGYHDRRWGRGWAIGAWFVPPCIVYAVPWLMFRELWRASDPAGYEPLWKTRPVDALVTVWWVVYGLIPTVGLFTAASIFAGIRQSDSAVLDFARQYDKFRAFNVVLSVVSVIAGVVYLLLVRQLAGRHMRATREA